MKKRWTAGILAAIAAVSLQLPTEVPAAGINPALVTLQPGVSYHSLDVTGDGIADELLIKTEEQSYFGIGTQKCLEIYINGEEALALEDAGYQGDAVKEYEVKLCTADMDTPLFFISTCSEAEYYNFCRLYRFETGRLNTALDLKKTYETVFHHREHIEVKEVSSGRICFQWYGQLGASGALNWEVNYTVSGGNLRLEHKISNVTEKDQKKQWTVARDFTVYTNAGLKQEAFQAQEGERFRITQVYSDSRYMFLKVVNASGQEGWIPCPNEQSAYFKEAVYV